MYPIGFEADFNAYPNRWTTFFRIILAIPWLIVAYVYLIRFVFTHIFAWVVVVILGRYPQWLYEFNSGVVRYSSAPRPGSTCRPTSGPLQPQRRPSYPIRVNFAPAAESQSRLKAFFRLDPRAADGAGRSPTAPTTSSSWPPIVAWLTIVFRGYLPEGVNSMLTFVNSFHARVFGYLRDPHRRLPADRDRGRQARRRAAASCCAASSPAPRAGGIGPRP